VVVVDLCEVFIIYQPYLPHFQQILEKNNLIYIDDFFGNVKLIGIDAYMFMFSLLFVVILCFLIWTYTQGHPCIVHCW